MYREEDKLEGKETRAGSSHFRWLIQMGLRGTGRICGFIFSGTQGSEVVYQNVGATHLQ